MNRLFYYSLIILLLLSNTYLSGETRIEVTPSHKHILHPDQTIVQIKLKDVVNLYSASVTILFDQFVISYTEALNGNILSGITFVNSTSNSITYDLSNLDLSQFTGSGILFSVQFNSVGLGTSPVTVTDLKLRDNNNNPLPAAIFSGSITVSSPPVIVFVDHSYNSSNSGTHDWGYDAFASIQEGINAVTLSGIIVINRDTYNEDCSFNKSLVLITTGSGITVIRSVTITGSSMLWLNNNITITNSISCINGKINTGGSVIDLNSAATVTESDGNYIIGYLRISQPVGTAASAFGNIGVEINSGSDVGNMTITRVSGPAGKTIVGSAESINRKWIIDTDIDPSPGRILTFHWVEDDQNGMGSNGCLCKSANNGITWSTSGNVLPYSNYTFSSSPMTVLSSVWTISDAINDLGDATGFVVNAKVFLQGSFNGTGMNTYLNLYDHLPLIQPYSSFPLNYLGSESVQPGFFMNHSNIVDWIIIEVRENSSSTGLISRRAGFLLNNGTVVDTNGVNPVEFKGIVEGNYFIVLRHRNHLAVMSSTAVALNIGSTVYDFTTSQSKAFNSASSPMKPLAGGNFGLYSGDANSDGTVDAVDINVYWRPNNGLLYNYSKYADYNMDATIDALDINLYWRANNSKSSLVP